MTLKNTKSNDLHKKHTFMTTTYITKHKNSSKPSKNHQNPVPKNIILKPQKHQI